MRSTLSTRSAEPLRVVASLVPFSCGTQKVLHFLVAENVSAILFLFPVGAGGGPLSVDALTERKRDIAA